MASTGSQCAHDLHTNRSSLPVRVKRTDLPPHWIDEAEAWWEHVDGCDHCSKYFQRPDAHTLIGRRVVVTLDRQGESPVVARGKLLAHNEWGEVVLQDEMGGLQFCWPNLAIALDHDPTAQGDWP